MTGGRQAAVIAMVVTVLLAAAVGAGVVGATSPTSSGASRPEAPKPPGPAGPALATGAWVVAPGPLSGAGPGLVGATPAGRPSGPATVTVAVDPGRTYQTMVGFGASLTASSAQLIEKLPASRRRALLEALFSPTQGAGIDLVLVPMGASDFAPHPYTYDDLPPDRTDPRLGHFSIRPDRSAVLPVLRAALAVNPQLRVLAAPWSAPAWMKTSGRLDGGSLEARYTRVWADYFVDFVRAYARAGVPVWAVMPQNEPTTSSGSYPTMTMSEPTEAAFIARDLGPALRAAHLPTRIFGYDQDWSTPAYPLALVTDPSVDAYLAGTAWHCYGGLPSAQDAVHDAAPDQEILLTECSGGDWSSGLASDLQWESANLLTGAVSDWSSAVMFWNLALDPSGGPHDGGCGDCRGLVTITRGRVTGGSPEYALLDLMGRTVRPGSVRVGMTISGAALDAVAFRNPDGSFSALLADPGPAQTVAVEAGGRRARVTVPAAGAAGVVIGPG